MDSARRHFCLRLVSGSGALLFGESIAGQDLRQGDQPTRSIQVTARKFTYTPNTIVVQKGESVVLEFTAVDFMHGFNIPDLKIRADLMPGRPTRIPLTLERAGTYDFLCDNFCGSGHEEMNGKIIVKD